MIENNSFCSYLKVSVTYCSWYILLYTEHCAACSNQSRVSSAILLMPFNKISTLHRRNSVYRMELLARKSFFATFFKKPMPCRPSQCFKTATGTWNVVDQLLAIADKKICFLTNSLGAVLKLSVPFYSVAYISQQERYVRHVSLMLDQRHRRWSSSKPTWVIDYSSVWRDVLHSISRARFYAWILKREGLFQRE